MCVKRRSLAVVQGSSAAWCYSLFQSSYTQMYREYVSSLEVGCMPASHVVRFQLMSSRCPSNKQIQKKNTALSFLWTCDLQVWWKWSHISSSWWKNINACDTQVSLQAYFSIPSSYFDTQSIIFLPQNIKPRRKHGEFIPSISWKPILSQPRQVLFPSECFEPNLHWCAPAQCSASRF